MAKSKENAPVASTVSRWPVWATAAAGLAAGGLGLSVLLVPWLRNPRLSGPPPLAIPFATSLGLVLGGLALGLYAAHRPRAAAIFGTFLGLLGLFGLVVLAGYLGSANGAIARLTSSAFGAKLEAGRPAPATALAFAFCGAALMIHASSFAIRARDRLTWTAASLTLTLCFTALIGQMVGLAGTYTWGQVIGMGSATAIGLTFLALGLLAWSLQYGSQWSLGREHWLPYPVGMAVLTAALLVWQALVADQRNQLRQLAKVTADQLGDQVLEQIHAQLRAVDRMARRWERSGGTPRAEWEADAAACASQEKGFQAIEWADPSFTIRWVEPWGDNAAAAGLELARNPQRRRSLEEARDQHRMIVTPTIELLRGGKGFLACFPLQVRGRPDGVLLGVFRIGALFDSARISAGAIEYAVAVFNAAGKIYPASVAPRDPPGGIRAETTFAFPPERWRIVLSPTPDFVAAHSSHLPDFVLGLGLILAALMMGLVHTLQGTRAQARVIDYANRDLGREIAERVQTETKLRASEEKFRQLAASAPIGIFQLDPDGGCTYVNPKWQSITGLSAEEAQGTGWEKAIHPDDKAGVFTAWGEAVRDGSEFGHVFRFVTPAGKVRWVNARAVAVRDERDQLVGYVGSNEEITALKELQNQLIERNDALAVETRLAHEGSRMKSEFLTNISHELRTPLNAVIGFSSFLVGEKPGPLNAQQKEFLSDILNSGRHLLRLINDLLDLAKIEAGKIEVRAEPFSLRAAVAEVAGVLRPLVHDKQIAFQSAVELADDVVTLDQQKFKQVLYNLLSNAIKFTGERGEVSLRVGPRGAGDFEVRIADTGIGIRREDFAKLFVQFQQLDTGANRRFQGTGLGLALTKKFVELCSGKIEVESEFGRGTVFTVVLPRLAPLPASPADRPEARPVPVA